MTSAMASLSCKRKALRSPANTKKSSLPLFMAPLTVAPLAMTTHAPPLPTHMEESGKSSRRRSERRGKVVTSGEGGK